MKSKQFHPAAAPFCVRQGDVLLVDAAYRGDKFVSGQPVESADGRIVLAFGEVTGHAHVVAAGDRAKKPVLRDVQAERYLQVLSEATIRHEEHSPIILREGRYQQAFQTEEQGEEVRRVAD